MTCQVFERIETIAAHGGKNDKIRLIAEGKDDPNFIYVLKAALDGFTTYGMAKIPNVKTFGTVALFSDEGKFAIEGLAQMARRDLTGGEAKNFVTNALQTLDEPGGILLRRIITRDLRAGFTSGSVNKAIPGLIREFDCALAKPFEEKRVKTYPVPVEPKLDGWRVLVAVDLGNNSVRFLSRTGKEYTSMDHLVEPVLAHSRRRIEELSLPSDTLSIQLLNYLHGVEVIGDQSKAAAQFILEAEVVSGTFNETASSIGKKDGNATDAVLNIFDIIPAHILEVGKGKINYTQRRRYLEHFLKGADTHLKPIERYLAGSVDDIMEYYAKFRARGLEGVIVKDPAAVYEAKRGWFWMKIKAEETIDLRITGAVEGEGKYIGMLGKILVDHKGVEVGIGTGLSDKQRADFWEACWRDQAAGIDPMTEEGEFLGRISELEYHEVTPDGSLRHGRFVRFRDDKRLDEAA